MQITTPISHLIQDLFHLKHWYNATLEDFITCDGQGNWYCKKLICVGWFLHVYQLDTLKKLKNIIWLICIFNMAAKIAELCFEQHIFLSRSAVHSFYCMGLKCSYVTLLEVSQKTINIWLVFIFNMTANLANLWVQTAHHSVYSCLHI